MKNPLIPVFGTTKSKLIEILENDNLTLKEINLEINKFGKTISYQATHKAINELIRDEIIEKLNNKYSLNEKWLANLSNFIAKANSTKENSLITEQQNVEQYSFITFLDAAKFTLRFFDEIPNPQNKKGVCICKHSWPLFGVSPKDYELLAKVLKETKFYEIIESNTKLDKSFGEALKKLGKIVKFGEKIDILGDIVVKGEYILQIIYSQTFEKQFDKIFKEYNSIEQIPVNKLIENFSLNKTNITAYIIKDKNYAEKLRKRVLDRF